MLECRNKLVFTARRKYRPGNLLFMHFSQQELVRSICFLDLGACSGKLLRVPDC